jgi:hypothetical protein
MAFKDEMERGGVHSPNENNHSILVTRDMLHKIANTAAEDFINLLTKKYEVSKFVRKYVSHNALVRLVYNTPGGNECVVGTWNDVSMAWLLERHIYTTFMDFKFIAVTDILVDGPYTKPLT